MIPRRSPTVLRGLVCMTDFLFAVIAGLLFLIIQLSHEAEEARIKSTPTPETSLAVAGNEARLRALETSAQELKTDLAVLAQHATNRSREVTKSSVPVRMPTNSSTK